MIESLLEKSKKMTSLLEELQTSNTAEKYRYVIRFEYKMGSDDVYSLYDNLSGSLKLDKLERINSWLNIRGIDVSNDVYSSCRQCF